MALRYRHPFGSDHIQHLVTFLQFSLLLLVAAMPSIAFSQQVYYPLHVGTRWHFQGQPLADYQPSAPKEVLKDTVMGNGKTYAAVLYDPGPSIQYQRVENDSVFIYNFFTRQEKLLFRFNASEKETVVTYIGTFDTTDVILTDTTMWSLFGRSVRVYRFLIDVRHIIDDEEVVTIADGFGVVRVSMSFGYYTTLAGAVIDGVTYGTIQSFAQRYYPLTVGNQWFYDSTTHPFAVKVISDSLFSNGYKYSILSSADYAGGRYVRVDSHYVYYYDEANHRDVPFFKLDGKIGDKTDFGSLCNGFSRSIILGIDTMKLFGETTRVIRYQLDEVTKREVSLSDKFGLVSIAFFVDPPPPWPDHITNAVGCIIDGWRYGLVTSVRNEKITPDGFSLAQNYPNPFNPSTTIRFTLAKPSPVKLEVFDCLGRRVATLVSERMPAGSYARTWNAAQCASGVYYYRLTADSRSEIKKMLLMR